MLDCTIPGLKHLIEEGVSPDFMEGVNLRFFCDWQDPLGTICTQDHWNFLSKFAIIRDYQGDVFLGIIFDSINFYLENGEPNMELVTMFPTPVSSSVPSAR